MVRYLGRVGRIVVRGGKYETCTILRPWSHVFVKNATDIFRCVKVYGAQDSCNNYRKGGHKVFCASEDKLIKQKILNGFTF